MMKDGAKKKVSLRRISADQKIASVWGKKCLVASYSTSNKFLLVVRHTLTTGLHNAFKVGTVNVANSLSLPSIVKKVSEAPEVKAAKGLK